MKVIVKKQLHCCNASAATGDIWMQKRLDLPFAPQVGLELGGKIWSGGIIKEQYYDIDHQYLKCFVEDDKTYTKLRLTDRASESQMEALVQRYLNEGWERS